MCNIDWSAVAAWVQAIGSVLAIGAAIWVGERSAKQSRDLVESERRRQADIVASTIAMKLHLVGVELRKKSAYVLELAKRASTGQNSMPDKNALNQFFLLTEHETLAPLRVNVTLFERDTGILTNTALDVLDGHNPSIKSAIATFEFKGNKPSDFVGLCTLVNEQMIYISGLCSAAEKRLETMHDLDRDSSRNAPKM